MHPIPIPQKHFHSTPVKFGIRKFKVWEYAPYPYLPNQEERVVADMGVIITRVLQHTHGGKQVSITYFPESGEMTVYTRRNNAEETLNTLLKLFKRIRAYILLQFLYMQQPVSLEDLRTFLSSKLFPNSIEMARIKDAFETRQAKRGVKAWAEKSLESKPLLTANPAP